AFQTSNVVPSLNGYNLGEKDTRVATAREILNPVLYSLQLPRPTGENLVNKLMLSSIYVSYSFCGFSVSAS
ncbi:MAG: hypothetical protein NTV15_04025, partial [Candidatus Bathyarchaeota archaeon]|nr:hypothetical protein [Candidatus Bathyarchaeota archaeon]